MTLNVGDLITKMMAAAEQALISQWAQSSTFAKRAFTDLAEQLAWITAEYKSGNLDEETCGILLQANKNTARGVLLAVEGLGLLAAEAAINAALGVVKDAVNESIGFVLL